MCHFQKFFIDIQPWLIGACLLIHTQILDMRILFIIDQLLRRLPLLCVAIAPTIWAILVQ